MITMTAKLHMILILIIVGVSLYMFLLYKEIRIFETEIRNIKAQVSTLSVAFDDLKNTNGQLKTCLNIQDNIDSKDVDVASNTFSGSPACAVITAQDIDNDGESVTSNELKDLIDTIQDDGCLEMVSDEDIVIDDDDVRESIIRGQMEKEANESATYSEDALKEMKLQDIRAILRRHGIQAKGTKNEMIARILEIPSKETVKNEDNVQESSV